MGNNSHLKRVNEFQYNRDMNHDVLELEEWGGSYEKRFEETLLKDMKKEKGYSITNWKKQFANCSSSSAKFSAGVFGGI